MRHHGDWPRLLGVLILLALTGGWVVSDLSAAQAAASSAAEVREGTEGRVDRAVAEQVFERLKQLAGEWESRSTAGWEGSEQFAVLARGSVVLATFRFKDAQAGGMATVMHMDGDRVLLTHYCEARNQPRLVLSRVEDGGRTAIFTFLDGTNMASRDAGHMDKVVFRFQDNDHYTSQWTWYQGGQEKWLEEITYTRVHERSQR